MATIRKIIVYLLGLLIIAVGINLSKLAGLGISPVTAIPRALEVIWGLSLGKMVIIVYCALIFLQFLVLGKDFKPKNLLGIIVAIIFGWMVDFVGINPDTFGHLLAGIPKPESYIAKLFYLFSSIILIGIGVFIYLKPNFIPMPAEGLALAISQKFGKSFGDSKTGVDVGLILIALILQLIFLGGKKSFSGNAVVVREGTVAAAVFVGQLVKFLKKLF